MRGLMSERPLLISTLIQHAARYHGDVEIVSHLVDRSIHRYTYAEAERRSRRLARALLRLGIGPATGSAPWPGTASGISSCITASPGSARCATRSTRACSTSRSSTSSTTPRTGCCLSRPASFRWSSGCGRNCRRIAASCCWSRPKPACRCSRCTTSWSTPRAKRASPGPSSTNGPPRRCATRRARPASPRASFTATARPCCTPTACRCPTRSRCRAATRSARSCRCSTPAAGACLMSRPMNGTKLVLPGPHLDGASLYRAVRGGGRHDRPRRADGLARLRGAPRRDRGALLDAAPHPVGRVGGAALDDRVVRPSRRRGLPGLGHDRDEPGRHDGAADGQACRRSTTRAGWRSARSRAGRCSGSI